MNIITIKEIASTNIYAVEQLKNKLAEWTIYIAENQIEGKGQQGNSWESEQGKNLTFSIVLSPTFLPVYKQYLISKIVCLGIENTLSDYIDNIKIKWPNDIYVENKKICGILIENQILGTTLNNSVVGIGMNINQEQFISNASNPISLKQITNATFNYNLNDILYKTLVNIRKYYELLKNGNINKINEDFLLKMYRVGEWHKFIDINGEFEGCINGVNEIGQLLVNKKNNNKQSKYNFKEISFII